MTSACLAAAVAAVLLLPATAPAAPGPGQGTSLKVQTQNLDTGTDLGALLAADDSKSLLVAADRAWAEVKASDLPARVDRVAGEITAANPDVVALQEVPRWRTAGADEPSLDGLELILTALGERGLGYFVAAISDNADIGPMPVDAGRFQLRIEDFDVILVRNRAGLTFDNPRHGTYVAQGPGLVSLQRGWASTDGALKGKAFRFVTTQLGEAPADQAAELVSALDGAGRVIVAGDAAAPGSQAYATLTGALDDGWGTRSGGFTCCQTALSALTTRTDLVLTRGTSAAQRPTVRVVGTRPADRTPDGRWPSDHAGLRASVLL